MVRFRSGLCSWRDDGPDSGRVEAWLHVARREMGKSGIFREMVFHPLLQLDDLTKFAVFGLEIVEECV